MHRSSYGNPPKSGKGSAGPCNMIPNRVSPTAPTVNPTFTTPGLGEGCCKGEHVTPIGAGDNKPSNGNKPTGGF